MEAERMASMDRDCIIMTQGGVSKKLIGRITDTVQVIHTHEELLLATSYNSLYRKK